MAVIEVDKLGKVEIAGDNPTAEEQEAIFNQLQQLQSSEDALAEETIIPEMIDPNLGKQNQLKGLEYIGGRPTFEAIGGIGGGIVGTPAGLPGVVGAGVLATSGAGQVYDIMQGYLTDDSPTFGTQTEKLKKDFQREAILQTLFAKIPGLGKGIKSLFVKKDPKTKSLYESAKRMGFPLSISDSGNMVAKGYGKVVGLFPFVGTPTKKQIAFKADYLNKSAEDTLNLFAPNVSLTNLGIDMTDAAKGTFGDFKRISGFFYDDFYRAANKIKDPIIPTNNFRDSLQKYTKLIDEGTIPLGKKNLKSPQKDAIYNYAKSAQRIPEFVNVSQYRALIKDIQTFAKKSQNEGYDLKVLTGLKSSLERDLNKLTSSKYLDSFKRVLDPSQMKDIQTKLSFANKVYAQGLENSMITKALKKQGAEKGVKIAETVGINIFDSPMAKKFKSVDKNIFGAGFEKPGSITADQLGNALISSRNITPQMLQDLQSLVGQKQYNKFVRKVFDKAFDGSIVTSKEGNINGLMFDPFKFQDALGLNTKGGREIVEKMISGSKLSIEKLDDFFNIAKNHAGLQVPDVSSFVARRATLGGTKSVFGGMAMGYSTFNNPVRGLGLIYLARKGSAILADPKNLDDVMNVMDYDAPGYKVYNSSLKLIDAMLSENKESMRNVEKNGLLEMREFIEQSKKDILKNDF